MNGEEGEGGAAFLCAVVEVDGFVVVAVAVVAVSVVGRGMEEDVSLLVKDAVVSLEDDVTVAFEFTVVVTVAFEVIVGWVIVDAEECQC